MMIAKFSLKADGFLIGHKAEVNIRLDDTYPYSENNTHEFVFNIKEKDNYKLIVEPIIKYKIPIDIDFTKE